MMEFSFTSEQDLIRENIIAFAKKELNKDVAGRDREQKFLRELWQKCADQKLTGLPVGESFGGAGLDAVSAAVALEALGYGSEDGGLNFSICAHLLACVVPIWKFGSGEQKKKFLPDLCNGKKIAVNAMTESESGSDVFSIQTKAERKGDKYIINGNKTFCSNGPVGDMVLVYALTDASKGYYGGISAFLLDLKTAGCRIGQKFEKMGLRTSGISEIVFENVEASADALIGGEGGGAVVFNHSMEWERTCIAACHVGTMRRLLEKCIAYAQSRKSGSEVIGKKQAVAHRIANMKVQTEAAALMVYRAASGLEKNRDNMIHASAAKLFTSEAFVTCATDAMQVFGGNGYMTEFGIERILRDALGSTLYSGTSDIQRNIISRLLGL
ncbi:MAG: acyl-CoA dehydrogenase family protein [Bacteroidia bacterium]